MVVCCLRSGVLLIPPNYARQQTTIMYLSVWFVNRASLVRYSVEELEMLPIPPLYAKLVTQYKRVQELLCGRVWSISSLHIRSRVCHPYPRGPVNCQPCHHFRKTLKILNPSSCILIFSNRCCKSLEIDRMRRKIMQIKR